LVANVAHVPVSLSILARLASLARYLCLPCFMMRWPRRGWWQPNFVALEPVPKDATGKREVGGGLNKFIPPPRAEVSGGGQRDVGS
jgi:hypothetical protein